MTAAITRKDPALALLALASLITALDYNIVYVALPNIGAELGFSAQTLQWVVSAYAVAFGGFLLLGGRACDLLGRRRMFVLGLALYAVSSLAGGFATTPAMMIAARAGQGLGGAALFPATLALVNSTFAEGPPRHRALAVWGSAGGSGMVLGSLLGGVLTEVFGWAAVFLVNVPLAGAAALLAFPLLARDPARVTDRRFDLPGAITVTTGATLVVMTLVQGPEVGWTSPATALTATIGALLLVAFAAIETRTRQPLVPLRLLRNRNLATGLAITFLFMATFGTLLYFFTLYLQSVHGYGALQTGTAFLVPMLAVVVGSGCGGRLASRFGVRATLLAGLVLGLVGTIAVGLSMSPDGSYVQLLPGLVGLGIGQGIAYTAMFAAAGTGVAADDQGVASGLASTGQQVGGALGLAVLVAIANAGLDDVPAAAMRAAVTDGLRTAVLVAAAGLAVAVLVALNLDRAPARTAERPVRLTDQSPARP